LELRPWRSWRIQISLSHSLKQEDAKGHRASLASALCSSPEEDLADASSLAGSPSLVDPDDISVAQQSSPSQGSERCPFEQQPSMTNMHSTCGLRSLLDSGSTSNFSLSSQSNASSPQGSLLFSLAMIDGADLSTASVDAPIGIISCSWCYASLLSHAEVYMGLGRPFCSLYCRRASIGS